MNPATCVIAYGLPTSKQGFHEKVCDGSDYTSAFAGGWLQYRATCDLIRRSIDTCQRYGAAVIEQLHAAQLSQLFQFDAVILFAHCVDSAISDGSPRGGRIELWDTYVGASEMLAAVPAGYSGTIDLCACHPIALLQALKAERPFASVKYEPDLLLPSVWAEIYATVFMVARQPQFVNMSYAELLETVVLEYRRQTDPRNARRSKR